MNKKFTLALAAFSLLTVGKANADTKLVAVDSPTATTVASFSLNDISKLSFAGDKMVVTMTDKSSKEVALSTSLVLKFDNTETAISHVSGAGSSLKLAYDGSLLSAAGLDRSADAAIYSVGGQKVLNLKSWNGSPVSTESLADGVYILKVNNKSFKFVKK